MEGQWRNGFCNCCSSPLDCFVGFCCAPIEAALAANNAGQGVLMAVLQCLFYPCLVPLMRFQAREDRGIEGNVVKDILAGCCCPCCASIQVKTEFD